MEKITSQALDMPVQEASMAVAGAGVELGVEYIVWAAAAVIYPRVEMVLIITQQVAEMGLTPMVEAPVVVAVLEVEAAQLMALAEVVDTVAVAAAVN